MGMIRKTLSISTLGLVSWRSKKELLREAEAELAETRADLERTSKIEALLRDKLDDAEKRAVSAELTALRDARRARRRGARNERSKFPRRKRLTAAATAAVKPVIGTARGAAERFVADAEPVVDDAADAVRTRGRRARKKLEKKAAKAEKKARARGRELEKKARVRVDRARDELEDRTVDLRDRAAEAADAVGDRARELTDR